MLRCKQARCKFQLDPTVEEVKKLCNTCRKYAKSERVLFHYNGHGVPKPTANGEIWLFNKVFYYFEVLPCYFIDITFRFFSYSDRCIGEELYSVYPLANQRPGFLVEDTVNICFWLLCCWDDCQCLHRGIQQCLSC